MLVNRLSKMIKIGIVGAGRIASRFVKEAATVSEVGVSGVFGINQDELSAFAETNGLIFSTSDFARLLFESDAIYIASPHQTHYEYARKALENGRHVLCEKPITLEVSHTDELYRMAKDRGLVLLEAIKTAYAPGFIELVKVCRSGLIGEIWNIDATFTKLVTGNIRELQKENAGGSMTELSTYPLLAAMKLLGTRYEEASFVSSFASDRAIDLFTKITLIYKNAVFTGKTGLGVKSEGDLIISGTKGYIYVPAPWWKTETFEARFEDPSKVQKFSFPFEGDGLRYEIKELHSLISSENTSTEKLTADDSTGIIRVIESFLKGRNIRNIS
jgi:predicted dehydrogenase